MAGNIEAVTVPPATGTVGTVTVGFADSIADDGTGAIPLDDAGAPKLWDSSAEGETP